MVNKFSKLTIIWPCRIFGGQLFGVPQVGFLKDVTFPEPSNRLFCWSRCPEGGSNMATTYEGELELELEYELNYQSE